MAGKYAANTSVSTVSTRSDIEKVLAKYGCDSFAFAQEPGRAALEFLHEGRRIRFILPLPDKRSKEFTHTEARGYERDAKQALALWEQACRQKWRALFLAIKAKLESVESGIETFEEAFLAQLVLPSNQTFGHWAAGEIERVYEDWEMPALLPGTDV